MIIIAVINKWIMTPELRNAILIHLAQTRITQEMPIHTTRTIMPI
jgi:hypothetical protein